MASPKLQASRNKVEHTQPTASPCNKDFDLLPVLLDGGWVVPTSQHQLDKNRPEKLSTNIRHAIVNNKISVNMQIANARQLYRRISDQARRVTCHHKLMSFSKKAMMRAQDMARDFKRSMTDNEFPADDRPYCCNACSRHQLARSYQESDIASDGTALMALQVSMNATLNNLMMMQNIMMMTTM